MKKISENIWEFDPQVYPQLLWVAVNPTEEEQKKFTTIYNEPEEDLKADLNGYHAVVDRVRFKESRRTGNIITFSCLECINFTNVAHESSHVAMDICSYCGVKTHYDNQEPISYLIGWVAKCCEKVKNEIENGNRTM